jgi:hypothetical protein
MRPLSPIRPIVSPRRAALLIIAATITAIWCGCARPRFVEVSREGGVVAIPSNSNQWPTYYRDKAEKLIREKCPDGYEVVMEEEVVTGQVTHVESRTKTKEAPSLDLGKIAYDSQDPENNAASLAGVKIPLGRKQEDVNATTSSRDVTEYHIHYRPKVR